MIASSLGTIAVAVLMVATGVLMLAYSVRGVPRSPSTGPAQSDSVLVATKSKKKSK